MSSSIRSALGEARRGFQEQTASVKLNQALLACGMLYALLYPIVNDVIAAMMYDGYSRTSQAVSELSAVGAPPRGFLTALSPLSSFCC